MFNSFKKGKLIILGVILLGSLLFVGTVFAQEVGFGSVDNIAGLSGYQTKDQSRGMSFLNTTIADVINIFLGLIGVVFVGLMVYSGYQWMTAGGEEEKVAKATARIKNSAIGLVIILLAFIGTKTVFTFFYQQAGDRTTGAITAPISCTTENCPLGYECQGGVCQLASEADGRRCEKNADCPPDQPICENFLQGWSYCSCRNDNDCKTSLPAKPYCVAKNTLPGLDRCSVCRSDSDCNDNKACDILNGNCVACSILDEVGCLRLEGIDVVEGAGVRNSGCIWRDNKCQKNN